VSHSVLTDSDVLLERDEEVSLLRALVAAAAAGDSTLAAIEGPPGIGKSRLNERGGRRHARARAPAP